MGIGIIGVGRLGSALIKGFINGGTSPSAIYAYDVSPESLKRIEGLSVNICESISELISSSETIIIAVKPHDVLDVVEEIASRLSENKTLISVAAFVPIRAIERYVGKAKVYRAMPNIAVEANKGFIALTPIERRDSTVESTFKILGEVVWVKEEVLDLLTVISASTPALVAELIDTFVLAALKAGVPYDIAKKAMATVFQGVGKLAEYKDLSDIRDSVITPRGSTIILIEKMYCYEVKGRLLKALSEGVEDYLERLKMFRKELDYPNVLRITW